MGTIPRVQKGSGDRPYPDAMQLMALILKQATGSVREPHKIHVWDVQAARSHVSGHKRSELSNAEIPQYLLALVLGDVSVQRLHTGQS